MVGFASIPLVLHQRFFLIIEGGDYPGLTEGRQQRSSPRAFVRSSHNKRIDLFEVGEPWGVGYWKKHSTRLIGYAATVTFKLVNAASPSSIGSR